MKKKQGKALERKGITVSKESRPNSNPGYCGKDTALISDLRLFSSFYKWNRTIIFTFLIQLNGFKEMMPPTVYNICEICVLVCMLVLRKVICRLLIKNRFGENEIVCSCTDGNCDETVTYKDSHLTVMLPLTPQLPKVLTPVPSPTSSLITVSNLNFLHLDFIVISQSGREAMGTIH